MSITGKSAAEMMAGISVKPKAAELRESRKREAEAERALLAVGTIWRENDPRPDSARLVKVVRCNAAEMICIQSVKSHRMTWARRDRFGDTKRGNYAFVRES